ncbi:hypothetical protein BU029_02035 [Staphylococcus simulans]|nr:hypothetical protein BU029_02035 [Staphylococcus simulans]
MQQEYSWEEILNLSFLGDNFEENFKNFKLMNFANDLDKETWFKLVEHVKKWEEKQSLNKVSTHTHNNAKIPMDPYSTWQLYKGKLRDDGFSENSIENIESSSIDILRELSMDTQETGPIKGLVVGNVQSGKTANMSGLMAMAADSGFNYFIILSGVIENLREQTANRILEDMKSSGNGNLSWNQVDNPSLKSNESQKDISTFNLSSNSHERYFTVCLKNKNRLSALKNWLSEDKNKAKQLKILIIDDEADQASINTKNMKDTERLEYEEQYTAINGLIREMVNDSSFGGMNYISYTATPYANVLNETTEDSLYPKDFIKLLESAEDYIGPKQMFGTEEPEQSPKIDIVLEIPDADAEIVKSIQKGDSSEPLPSSFKSSINWFLLSVSAMRSLGFKKPISMLVHTSFKIDHHEIIAKKIENYLKHVKDNFEAFTHNFEKLYKEESQNLTKDLFLKNMEDYSTPEKVPELPEWEQVQNELKYIFNLTDQNFVSHIKTKEDGRRQYHTGIHLAIDNSKSKVNDEHVRLVYPKKNELPSKAPAFIVVGGNTLSRGLTLEGLTTTYFLRTTNQADTLMQMGRWFGFRKGYELFPRVWLDRKALERFNFLSQMNEELRENIREYAVTGRTPSEYAVHIKNSPNYNLIRITSKNKSQAMIPAKFDFHGFNSQTIYFEKDKFKLDANMLNTKDFLNSLHSPEIDRNLMIWRDVSNDKVKDFLKKYHVSKSDIKMSTIPAMIKWLEKNYNSLNDWSVILSSIGNIKDTKNIDSDWQIQGYNPESVIRTKLIKQSDEIISNIGILRNPDDLLADINSQLTTKEKSAKAEFVQKTREKYGYGDTPQLLIYRVNKGDKEAKIRVNSETGKPIRAPLDFPQDIIGINIMIPGIAKGKNMTSYIQADIAIPNSNIDEDDYAEGDE